MQLVDSFLNCHYSPHKHLYGHGLLDLLAIAVMADFVSGLVAAPLYALPSLT